MTRSLGRRPRARAGARRPPTRRAAPWRASAPADRAANEPHGIVYFDSAAAWRRWLARHHAGERVIWVGYHKKGTGRPSLSWPESVDEALCFGWIDGIRKRVDEARYTIRFTPRKPGSVWSAVNTRRARELIEHKRMQPAGLRAFEARLENRSGVYSFEQRRVDLPPPYARRLDANAAARKFFESQPASYRKACFWWVVSAKREDTRLRRLGQLIEHSAQGRWIPQFLRTPKVEVTRKRSGGRRR